MNTLLEIMQKNNIQINLYTLCMGFKLHYIDYESFKSYELIKVLSDEEINQTLTEILSLFEVRDQYELLHLCNQLLVNLCETKEEREKHKWLFACLTYARDTISNDEELLVKVSVICADFDYPVSMKGLIYYFPSDDNDRQKCTVEEARQKLIRLLDTYLFNLRGLLAKK